MHAHSNKPVGQEWLIKIMQAFGYQHVQEEGQCFGIAAMAMQAFLSGEEDVFNERIKRLYRLSQLSVNQIKTLQTKPMNEQIDGYDLTIVDVRAFLENIMLYQTPIFYSDIFLTAKDFTQRNMLALPIVLPKKLDSNPPERCKIFCGAYDKQQLMDYLIQLQAHLTVRTSLMLQSNNHALNLSFDPQRQQWILFDANDLPVDENHLLNRIFKTHQSPELSQNIIDSFTIDAFDADDDSKKNIIFSTDCFVCKNDKIEFHKNYDSLQFHSKWKKIHEITPETAIKKDVFNSNLLTIAVRCGDYKTVQSLLNVGDNPNFVYGEYRWTPLHFAALHGHVEIFNLLLNSGAQKDCIDHDNLTPLHIAAQNEQFLIVEILLRNNVNVNCKGLNNQTPLHLAMQDGNLAVVKLLLDNHADPNLKNIKGQTPLHLAVHYGYFEIVMAILESGSDVNHVNIHNQTALHLAVQNYIKKHNNFLFSLERRQNTIPIIIALLEKGANQAVKDKKGNIPVNLLLADDSKLNMIIEISKTLKEKMIKDKYSKIDSTSPFGRLAQCSTFFEKLKKMSVVIEKLDEEYQIIAQDLYETFYQLGKAWIGQDTKNVLSFQTKINNVLYTYDTSPQKNSFGFFKQSPFFAVFHEANESLKEVMHNEKKPILDK